MARKEFTETVKKIVRERYGYRCVVCGKEESIDVAHIYEDATIRQSTSDRAVVMCTDHNTMQDRAHRKKTFSLHPDFQPTSLRDGMYETYLGGDYALSYGKARVAAYLLEQQRRYSDAVEYLAEGISALRPYRWGDWLAATMLEAERLCESYPIGVPMRWLFLDRIGLVLFDYGRADEGVPVFDAAHKLSSSLTSDYNPQEFAFDKRSSQRRGGLTRSVADKLLPGETRDVIKQQLEESVLVLEKGERFDQVATHLDTLRSISANQGDRETAHEYAERMLVIEPKIRNKWPLLEAFASEIEYYMHKNDLRKAIKIARRAMAIYKSHRIALEPVLGGSTMKAPSLLDRIRSSGITPDQLINAEIPIDHPKQELRLDLSKSVLWRVIRAVLENPGRRYSASTPRSFSSTFDDYFR